MAAVLADEPRLYYWLEETAGSVAADVTGNSPGTFHGATKLGVPGLFPGSRALDLDGTLGGIVANGEGNFEGTSPFTLELWFAPQPFGQDFFFLFSRYASEGGNRNSYGVWMSPDYGLELERYIGGAKESARAPGFPADGAFHHLVATYDGGALRLYVDGSISGYDGGGSSHAVVVGAPAGSGSSSRTAEPHPRGPSTRLRSTPRPSTRSASSLITSPPNDLGEGTARQPPLMPSQRRTLSPTNLPSRACAGQ